eukprot:SAG31_NODE_5904_length_2264_cov_1.732564_2_plen_97_part_00
MSIGVHGCTCGARSSHFEVPGTVGTRLQVLVLLVCKSGNRYVVCVHGCIISHMYRTPHFTYSTGTMSSELASQNSELRHDATALARGELNLGTLKK